MLSDAAEQRIAALPASISLEAVRICEIHQASYQTTMEQDFFLGYLTGFPVAFDNLSEQLGGLVRKILFDSIYSNNGEEFSRRSIRLVENEDQDVKFGFGFGITDGEHFFETIIKDRIYDGYRNGLRSMLTSKLSNTIGKPPSFHDLAARKKLLQDRIERFGG